MRSSKPVARSVEQVKREIRYKQPKTAKGPRRIALPALLVDALRRYRAEQAKPRLQIGKGYNDEGLLFSNVDGTVWWPNLFTTAFSRLLPRAGIGHCRFHDLRHTHASQMLREGIHPKVVSERPGHSTIAITLDTYSHLLPGIQEEAAERSTRRFPACLRKAGRQTT